MAGGLRLMAGVPGALRRAVGRPLADSHQLLAILAVALLVNAVSAPASAHDIPNDVKVQMFVKPAGDECRAVAYKPFPELEKICFGRTCN